MLLLFKDHLAPVEIAKRLKLPVTKVYQMLFRLKANLKKILTQQPPRPNEIPHPMFRIKRLARHHPQRIAAIA